tara:strand:+ start:131 stop:769 length:639 start_codon:yes stop_codon:yes gene_type:complete
MLTKQRIVRLKNLKRLLYTSSWKRIFLFVTEPTHEKLFARFRKINKASYLNNPEPWFTFSAIDFIQKRLKNGCRVLEWGSGSSSLWFEKNGCEVVSIEHSEDWAKVLRKVKSEKIDLILTKNKKDYVNPKVDFSKINIFLIDGVFRNECSFNLIKLIKSKKILSGTLIIFDDTSRLEYQKSVQSLTKCCDEVFHFTGISNIVIDKMTSVFIV